MATGSGVCNDEVTEAVRVYAIPSGTASASPSSVMYGGTSTLTVGVEPPGNYSYQWSPANMVTNPNSQTTQTVEIEETQVFTVTITSLDGGCSSTAQVTVAMAGSNLTATASADQTTLCEGESTLLHALPVAGTGNYSYNWSPANLLSSATSQNPVATPPVGTTTFHCTVSDGMTNQEVSVTITVNPNVESDTYITICPDETYNFFGDDLNTPNVYDHTIQSHLQCDSTIHLHLSHYETYNDPTIYIEDCNWYIWLGDTLTRSNTYERTLSSVHGCDSIVHLDLTLHYTPNPSDIDPADPENTAPHWVITATEFQINSYDFRIWETGRSQWTEPVRWRFVKKLNNDEWVDDPDIEWILEPDTTTSPVGKRCKMYVLNYIPDTIWLAATAKSDCGEATRYYWFVCSFYDVEEHSEIAADFSVIPNPNNGQMTLNFEHMIGHVEISVYNMFGALTDRLLIENPADRHSISYDMSASAPGMYCFVVSGRNGTITKKVIITQ